METQTDPTRAAMSRAEPSRTTQWKSANNEMEQEAEYKRNTQSQIQYSTLIVTICKYIMHNLNGSSLLLSELILDKVFKLYLLYKKGFLIEAIVR